MNDPNGLVCLAGEYHLFFQHTPGFVQHAPNSWGHAVSKDLVHWRQIDTAIAPDAYGWIWSGSAVVDWKNASGLQEGDEPPVIAVYTTGGFGDPPNACVQAIQYSNDRGRTFKPWAGNPVLGHIRAANRDPKVIWHAPTSRWIMALYLDANDYAMFASPNLKEWEHLCDLEIEETSECPDFFELPVDGDPGNTRWVFWGAAGTYRLGMFDGHAFHPETPALRSEAGPNGYAAQTWSDVPPEDGRCLQISWMRGGQYPAMPFNQQMSFPVELTLRSTPEGIRLFRQPAREIEALHTRKHAWRDHTLHSGMDRRALFARFGPDWREYRRDHEAGLLVESDCDFFDVRAEIELLDAEAFSVIVHGNDLCYDASAGLFSFQGHRVPCAPDADGRLELQLLIDRTSLELFAGHGRVSASFCFMPGPRDVPLQFHSHSGRTRLVSLDVHELASAWTD